MTAAEQRWMIDDQGVVHRDPRLHIAAEYTRSLPTYEFLEFAVRNLGFITLERRSNALEIRLRRNKVSPVALIALLYFVADHRTGKSLLSTYDAAWSHRVIGNTQDLWRHLNTLLTEACGSEAAQRFMSRRVDLHALNVFDPQAVLYRRWSENTARAPGEIADLANRLFAGRYTLARVAPSNEILIEETGNGYLSYGSGYLQSSGGTRFEDEPDTAYGRWVSEAAQKVQMRSRPLIEDVDALIGAQIEQRRRVRYRRIVLPFNDPLGGQYLITASSLNTDLDLRSTVA